MTMPEALFRLEDEPVFNEPWEAQAFALVLALHERGLFSWPEWTAALGAEIGDGQQPGQAETGASYYQLWLHTLEQLAVAKGFASALELGERRDKWLEAYLQTPHGQPVQLQSDG